MTDDQKRKEFGTSLLAYTGSLMHQPKGRWAPQAAIEQAEKAAAQAPPVIPSGPWSNNYAPNPTEGPLGYSIDAVAPVDPLSVAPAFPATEKAGASSTPAPPTPICRQAVSEADSVTSKTEDSGKSGCRNQPPAQKSSNRVITRRIYR